MFAFDFGLVYDYNVKTRWERDRNKGVSGEVNYRYGIQAI